MMIFKLLRRHDKDDDELMMMATWNPIGTHNKRGHSSSFRAIPYLLQISSPMSSIRLVCTMFILLLVRDKVPS
jgi:hypothetical protein